MSATTIAGPRAILGELGGTLRSLLGGREDGEVSAG
jgi:hypothetical protein